ncbi:uncharacterized protein LOC143653652 [Tamandua tetradactyla]|uniref:uncharacterized protein LOC143653652 n=1 Tax=Tamandua tetradactyla TaxID=48850 RepID=UPI00405468C7
MSRAGACSWRSGSINNNWMEVYNFVEDLVNKFKKFGFPMMWASQCCGLPVLCLAECTAFLDLGGLQSLGQVSRLKKRPGKDSHEQVAFPVCLPCCHCPCSYS